jgi:Sec-independent protein translocase protein TatA
MGDNYDKGFLGLGGWEWIIIIALLILIFFPDILSPKGKYIDNKCD